MIKKFIEKYLFECIFSENTEFRLVRPRSPYFRFTTFPKTILVLLHENLVFSRPLTVTGAIIIPHKIIDGIDYPEKVFFHQMTLDRIENGEYVLQKTQFTDNSSTGTFNLFSQFKKI